MGAPAFKYRALFEQHHIHVCSSNYALYGDMSNRVMSLLAEFSPEIEIYSIDEAFLKFTGFEEHYDLNEYGKQIRYQVTKGTGIPISVGFAPTKSLAKVANKIAKKFPERTENVHIIDSEEKRIKALKWLPLEDIWGIGRKHAQKLKALNIVTAYDFTQMNDAWVQKHLSIVGLRLKRELEGIPCLEMEMPSDKKNIATTRSFETNNTEYEPIRERVSTFAVTCAEKLRKQKSCCNALMVFIQTNRHRKDLAQYKNSIVIQLPYPTNSGIELSCFATKALEQIFKKGYAYKKTGVIAIDCIPEDPEQLNIFERSNPKHKALMKTIDGINQAIGTSKVKLASQDLKRKGNTRQDKLSPHYTTRITDVIKVKC